MSVMAATYPDVRRRRYTQRACAAHDVPSAFVAMRNGGTAGPTIDVPLIVFHGDRDNIVAPVNADRLIVPHAVASPA
jgi:hypothetical protein